MKGPGLAARLLRMIAGRRLLAVLVAATALAAPCFPTLASESPTPAPPAAAEAAPSAPTAGDHASRLGRNFLALMGDTWQDVALLAARITLGIVAGGILLLTAGLVGGLVLWLLLRRRGLFDAPFGWYRWARWLWCVLFALLPAVGCGYAGLWLGGGRAAKRAIRQDRVIDRTAANLMVAAWLDRAGYEVSGASRADEIEHVLADSEKIGSLALADFSGALDRPAGGPAGSAAQRRMLGLIRSATVQELARHVFRKGDPRIVYALFAARGPNVEGYMREHPDANLGFLTLSACFEAVRERACRLVDGAVHPNAALGAGLGLGIPLALLGIFRLVVQLAGRKRPPAEAPKTT